eukprot:gene7861-biopygen3084
MRPLLGSRLPSCPAAAGAAAAPVAAAAAAAAAARAEPPAPRGWARMVRGTSRLVLPHPWSLARTAVRCLPGAGAAPCASAHPVSCRCRPAVAALAKHLPPPPSKSELPAATEEYTQAPQATWCAQHQIRWMKKTTGSDRDSDDENEEENEQFVAQQRSPSDEFKLQRQGYYGYLTELYQNTEQQYDDEGRVYGQMAVPELEIKVADAGQVQEYSTLTAAIYALENDERPSLNLAPQAPREGPPRPLGCATWWGACS